MADGLPAAGYTTNTLRTTAEVRAALDDIFGVLARLIGAVASETAEITAGALSPAAAFIRVDNEGQVATDNLDSISSTNYSDGNIITLCALTPGSTTTIRHDQGVDGIQLSDAADWELTSSRWIDLRYDATAQRWVELRRDYGANDAAGLRAALGLGSAALLNNGAVDAATLGGVAASGYVEVGQPVGDADTVDGIDAAGFVQRALTSLQDMNGILRVNAGSLISNVNVGDEARFELDIDEVRRGDILFFRDTGTPANSYLTMRIFDSDGSTLLREIKFAAGADAPTFELDNGATVKTFAFVEELGDVGDGFATATLSSGDTDGQTLNQDSDTFDEVTLDEGYFSLAVDGSQAVYITSAVDGGGSASRSNPKIGLRVDQVDGGVVVDYEVQWWYIVGPFS